MNEQEFEQRRNRLKTSMRGIADVPIELVVKAKQGNEDAKTRIYEITFDGAYQTIKKGLHYNPSLYSEIDDLLTDGYMKAFSNLNKLQDDQFSPWLYVILRNITNDYFRKNMIVDKEEETISSRHRTVTFSQFEDSDFRDTPQDSIQDNSIQFRPEDSLKTKLIQEGVQKLLGNLPDNQREAIMKQAFEQKSIQEIAQEMDANESTVKSWISRGKQSMEEAILELRKQNKSFYSMAPIPFLVWAFTEEMDRIKVTHLSNLSTLFINQQPISSRYADGQIPVKERYSHTKDETGQTQSEIQSSTQSDIQQSSQSNPNIQSQEKVQKNFSTKPDVSKTINKEIPSIPKAIKTTAVHSFFSSFIGKITIFIIVLFVGCIAIFTTIAIFRANSNETDNSIANQQNMKYQPGIYDMGVVTYETFVYNSPSLDDRTEQYMSYNQETPTGLLHRIMISEISEDSEGNIWGKLHSVNGSTPKYVCIVENGVEYLSYSEPTQTNLLDFQSSNIDEFINACGPDNNIPANTGVTWYTDEYKYDYVTVLCDGEFVYY